jgi:hypothetical protein
VVSFYDTTIGEQVEFQRVLANAGFDFEDVRRVIKNPALAKKMRDALQTDYKPALLPLWWSRLEEQLNDLHAAAPVDVPDEWFDVDVSRFTPHTPNAQPLAVLRLLDKGRQRSVQRTFEFYVPLIKERLKNAGNSLWRWDGLKSDPKHLRLAPGVAHKPGLTIVSFDPTAHHEPEKGHRVIDLWGSHTDLAGPEVLAALALTGYGTTMNGSDKPYMNLPGYQVFYGSDWSHYPYVNRWSDDRQLDVNAYWADYRVYGWASPVVREC